MKIVQAAMAGTLESSDLMVKVSPDESGLDVVIRAKCISNSATELQRWSMKPWLRSTSNRGRSLLMIKARWTA